jgi:signal transduction histidine kinase
MPRTLLWRLLAINLLVVGVAVGVAALTIGRLADVIFASLMKEFHIQVDVMHQLFVAAMARALLLVSLVAGGVGLLLSIILFRRVVDPLRQMMTMAERIAAGDYAARAGVGRADEVGRLADSLNRMAAGLQTLERLRKDLVANVAHELRTPLANLQGYLEAIAEGVTPASSETMRSLHEEVLRLVRLVEALHELSLFDARLPRLHPQDVDVAALLGRLLDLRGSEFAAKGIALRTRVAPNGGVRADPDLLSQALRNLLDNALKYTPPGGEVEVDVRAQGPALRIAVTNSGEEIAPEDLPYVFERFYRGEKSRSRELGGAGIGLSIVQEVARAHGGAVGAESREGRTSVWLTLPATPS